MKNGVESPATSLLERNRTKCCLILLFTAVTAAPFQSGAQEASEWHERRFQDEDPLKGKVYDKAVFVLEGKYVKDVTLFFRDERPPALVIACSDGKVEKNYFSLSGSEDAKKQSNEVTSLEARIDGKKTSILSDGTGWRAFFFPRADLKKLLNAHTAIIGVKYHSTETNLIMQFDIPDPGPVFSGCPRDGTLNRKK